MELALVVLSKVLLMVLLDWAVVLSPLTFVLEVATQLKLEPTDAVKDKFTEVLSQMVMLLALFITGVGNSVKVMV